MSGSAAVLRVGVLGGTFDPPHAGHLQLGLAAQRELALDRVLFVPAGYPPHKPDRAITPAEHRIAMLRLTLAPYPHFELDRGDIDRPPPHFTVDLLPQIQRSYPTAALWLVIGGDSLRDFLTWDRPAEILRRCRLAVLPRPGATVDWPALEAALPGIRCRVDLLTGDAPPVSSTDIRRRLRRGEPAGKMLAPEVTSYIRRHRLYPRS